MYLFPWTTKYGKLSEPHSTRRVVSEQPATVASLDSTRKRIAARRSNWEAFTSLIKISFILSVDTYRVIRVTCTPELTFKFVWVRKYLYDFSRNRRQNMACQFSVGFEIFNYIYIYFFFNWTILYANARRLSFEEWQEKTHRFSRRTNFCDVLGIC